MADNKIYIGNFNIQKAYFGSSDAIEIYLGDNKVYPIGGPGPHDYSQDYLTLDIVSGGTIQWKAVGNGTSSPPIAKTISYSLDSGSTWASITSSSAGTTFNVSAGDKILFKGINDNYSTQSIQYSTFGDSTASFNVQGNVMSLLYGDNFTGHTAFENELAFGFIFRNANVKSAENLILPATTLAARCYYGMFSGSTIESAPELPASSLTQSCYYGMFSNCSSLTVAPELPATTMAQYCYSYMFQGTSLTVAPELPATSLSTYSYRGMFKDCTSLTTAPELPATMIPDYCYCEMFRGCTSLTVAPALPATELYYSCCALMFQGCTSLTSAPALSATTLADNCYSAMFAGCNSLVTAPALPATTLASTCYNQMFQGCTSLTSAPELPATTLVSSCYSQMFRDCTSLSAITCYATDISANGCTNNWVNGVASSGRFFCNTTAGWQCGDSGVPSGWDYRETNGDPSSSLSPCDGPSWGGEEPGEDPD